MRFATGILLLLLLHAAVPALSMDADSLRKSANAAKKATDKGRLMSAASDAYLEKGKVDSAVSALQAAIDVFRQAGDDTSVMKNAAHMGEILRHNFQREKAIEYYRLAQQYARKRGDRKKEINYMERIAYALESLGRHYEAIDSLKKAVSIAVSGRDKENEARLDMMIASEYNVWDEYVMGTAFLQESIRINDSLGNIHGLAADHEELAIMYGRQKKHRDALRQLFIADSLFRASGHKQEALQVQTNIGVIYNSLGEYDSAIATFTRSLENGDHPGYIKMLINSNLGAAYAATGMTNKAKNCFREAININNADYRDVEIDVANYQEFAKLFLKARQYDSALHYGRLCEKTCTDNGIISDGAKECLAMLADAYAAKGDMRSAFAAMKRYAAMQDSLILRNTAKSLAEAETRLNVSEKNRQLEVQAERARRHATANMLLGVAMTAVLVIALVTLVAYRRTVRKNKLLREQKAIIDEQLCQLDAAAGMKSKFLANISHELRTPVTILSGMLELMKNKEGAGANEKDKVSIAYNNSKKLQIMIEEILDLSKLENNEVQLNMQQRELAPLLRRVVEPFRGYMEKEKLNLLYSDEGVQGIFINVDENKFDKVISNLVYNAIKFNASGGWVQVKAVESRDDGLVVIEVSDSGRGIAQDDIPHIFERFYQGNATVAKAEGAGIGLSLVKEFTGLMGGAVTVTSTPGIGSTFTLLFPRSAHIMPQQEPVTDTELSAEDWSKFHQRQTVLIVEDNAEMRYYVKEILGDRVNLVETSNGREALEWLQHNKADLVISDIMMPEMDGKEFVYRLKNAETLSTLPVIMLTALADTVSQMGMLRLGVDDYILKPFNVYELRARVLTLLNNCVERENFIAHPPDPDDIMPSAQEADLFRERIRDFVLARLKYNSISVGDLASELAMSERQLYRLAQRLTGCTPAQLIKEVRLQKAYELLAGGHVYKIEDLARRVGFENVSYFSRQFLDRFGKRPAEFL